MAQDDVARFVRANGPEDSIVSLHSSFKSFGEVEDGPNAVIDGFASCGLTLVCPSFFLWVGHVADPRKLRAERNRLCERA